MADTVDIDAQRRTHRIAGGFIGFNDLSYFDEHKKRATQTVITATIIHLQISSDQSFNQRLIFPSLPSRVPGHSK
jgi:hypothetical protein